MTPLIVPVNATVAIMVFMSVWNDITIPLYFLTDSSDWTMPLSVYNFYGKYSRDWNLIFADLVLTSLPVLILYIFCQKYIVSGLTAGAVKGNLCPFCGFLGLWIIRAGAFRHNIQQTT